MSGLRQPVAAGLRAGDRTPSTRWTRGWLGGLGPADLGFVILLIVAFAWLIHEGHGNMFFYDEWTWIETRHTGFSAIFDSYNEHMEIVPLAVYQLMFHTIGLGHYRWYRLLAVFGHLGVVTAVYCFARSRIGPLALIVAVPLAFMGAGWEFILWGVNFGNTTAIALAVAALIWFDSDERSSVVGAALLVASLACSETAILFAIGLAVELTWRDRSLRRAWVWALPIALYLAWHIAFYESSGSSYDVSQVPKFGAQLAAAAAGGMFGKGFGTDVTLGWVVLGLIAVLIIYRLLRAGAWTPRFIAVLLTVLGYWALVAVGRANLGDPSASRYIYAGAVLLLLVVIESLRGIEVNRRSTLAFLVLGVLALIGGLSGFSPGESELYTGSTSEASQITALYLIRGFIPADLSLDPHWSPAIDAALYFPAAGDLHSTGAFSVSQLLQQGEEQRASADLTLVRGGELSVTPQTGSPIPGATAPTVELRVGGGLTRTRGCVRYVPSGAGSTLDLTLPAAGLTIRAQAATTPASHPPTEIFVRRFASGYENAPVASFRGARTLRIRARTDAAPQPWHVRLSPWETVTACTVAR